MTAPALFRTVGAVAAIGADPEALDGVAGALRGAGDELADLARRLDATLGAAGWEGPDADRFRRSWRSTHRSDVHGAAEDCRDLARRMARHADEQRRAAAGTGAPTRATELPPPAPSGRVLRGTVEGSFGPWSAALTGTLRIDDLGERRRVTYEEDLGAGVGVTGGSGVRGALGGHQVAAGTSGAVGVGVASTVRRSWTVDRDDVVGLLAALALQESSAGASGPLARAGWQLTRVVGALTGTGLGPPQLVRPERTEDLVAIELGAAGWAALGSADGGSGTARGDVAGRVAVGVAHEGEDSWLVLEADGTAAVAIGRLFPDGAGADGSLRIDVPLHGADDRPMVITTTGEGPDGDREVTRLAVDPEFAGAAVDGGRRALEALSRGDADGAAAALASVRWDPGAVAVDVTTIAVDHEEGGLDASVGPASVSFAGSDEEWERRP